MGMLGLVFNIHNIFKSLVLVLSEVSVAYIYILDTYRRNDNRRMINDRRTNKGRRKEGRMKEDARRLL